MALPPRDELLALVDANWREMCCACARATLGGWVVERDGLLLCGSPSGCMTTNMAIVTGPVSPATVREETNHHFRVAGLPFTVWTRAHADAALEPALAEEGFLEVPPRAGYGARARRGACADAAGGARRSARARRRSGARRTDTSLPRRSPSTACRASRRARTSRRMESVVGPGTQAFLAYRGGEAVAAAILCLSHGVGGIAWVATLPEEGGRGYGARRHLGRGRRRGSGARRPLHEPAGVADGRADVPPASGSRRRRTTRSSPRRTDGTEAWLGGRPRARRSPRHPVFHGWWIVLVAFICHAVNTGLLFYAWSVFLPPLAASFGGLGRVAGRLLGHAARRRRLLARRRARRRPPRRPPGRDRGRARPRARASSSSRGAGRSPALYLCLAGPVALGSTCIGHLPNNAAVARWFVRRRGRALGVSTAGISAGGIVFAPLTQHLVSHYGWRTALRGPRRPRRRASSCRRCSRSCGATRRTWGSSPTGCRRRAPAPAAPTSRLVEREMERSVRPEVAVRMPNFWLLAAAFGLTIAGLSAVLLYQVPLLIDRGFDAGARLARARGDGRHGGGRQARLRRAPRPLRPAPRRRRLLLPADGRRLPPLAAAERPAARLLRRPLRLRDGRQRDAAGEPRRHARSDGCTTARSRAA